MATDTNNEVVETETPAATGTNDEIAGTKTPPDTSDEVVEAKARPTDMDLEVSQTGMRPDLVWDGEALGLCVRVYENGAKSFIFVYRRDDRQHFIRIGKTPTWSLEAARDRAKKLRSILDQDDDPALYHKLNNVALVENIIRYIAEHLQTKP
jgi:hypothetical protein